MNAVKKPWQQTKCVKCRELVHWEMIGGGRVYTIKAVSGPERYRTRCGCGEVMRLSNGRRAR